MHSDKARFLVAGGSTTAISYLAYALFLWVMDPKAAYALSYVLSIGWSYWVTSTWVFRRPLTWKGLLSFPLVYVVQALLSFLLFVVLLDRLLLPPLAAPLVTIILMLPLTYVLGRAVIHRTSPATPDPPPDHKAL